MTFGAGCPVSASQGAWIVRGPSPQGRDAGASGKAASLFGGEYNGRPGVVEPFIDGRVDAVL